MELFELVRSRYPSMTRSEQKVADAFLAEPDNFTFSTLDKISRSINTSTTTTIRFCRTLGFAGYKEFQDSLRQNVKQFATLPEKLQNLSGASGDNTLLESIASRSAENIFRTIREIPPEALSQALELIGGGNRLFIFGMRESFALVHYAYTRFLTVRDNVFMLDAGSSGLVESVLSLQKDDVCLVFLFHRYTRFSAQLLPLLRERGVKVILITAEPCEKIAPYADVTLLCHMSNGSIKNSSVAPICLLDYFCTATSMRAPEEQLEHMHRIEEILAATGTV